jgi:hypothetical protein
VWKATSSGPLEVKVLIPRDELRVLGDDTHADDRSASRSRLLESMPNEFGTETPATLLGRHAQPFQVGDGRRSKLERDASCHGSVRVEQIVGNPSIQVRSHPTGLAVGWVGGCVLGLEVESLGNVAKGAPDDARQRLGVFRSCLADRGIHFAFAA